jgi:RimJ/RimL family protein N-acetyltransferase
MTRRLDLVPLRRTDADEMVDVLSHPALYGFTGGQPPSLEDLRVRYERQAAGRSADGSETWGNWIVRLRLAGEAIGYVQATITGAGERRSADIAWVIGVPWQGHGYATEAAQLLVATLAADGVRTITAHVHPDHAASAAVARAAGLEPTDELEDGERVWRRTEDGNHLG